MKFFFRQALLLDLFLFAGWGVSVLFPGNSSTQDPISPMLFDLIPLSGGLICLIVLSLISAFYIRSRRGAIALITIVAVAPLFMWLDFYFIRHQIINDQFSLHIIYNFMIKYVAAPFVVTFSSLICIEYIIVKIPMGENIYKKQWENIMFFYSLFCMIGLGRAFVQDSYKNAPFLEFACVFFGIIAMPAVALKIDSSLAKAAASFAQQGEESA